MTLKEWHDHLTAAFRGRKAPFPSQEAKWLIEAALEKERGFIHLYPSYCPTLKETKTLTEWAERRLKGEPLSRLKGMREFWSLPFLLNEDTLDPRPETEILVEGVLSWVQEKKQSSLHILDLGTGTGCIIISLLHECPRALGVGTDISSKALEIAHLNATLNQVSSRLDLLQGTWGEPLLSSFDVIVSNPPYISLQDKSSLDSSVLDFDPHTALFGGEDGLVAYRQLRHDIKRLLKPEGLAAIEIGATQRPAVEKLFHDVGFRTVFALKDLAHHDRVLGFQMS